MVFEIGSPGGIILLSLIIGGGVFGLLVLFLVPPQKKAGKILEKYKGSGKIPWVKVVFEDGRGKKQIFFVDNQFSQYIIPGERGILVSQGFHRPQYQSLESGLIIQGLEKNRIFLLVGLIFGFFLFLVVFPYFYYFDTLKKKSQTFLRPLLGARKAKASDKLSSSAKDWFSYHKRYFLSSPSATKRSAGLFSSAQKKNLSQKPPKKDLIFLLASPITFESAYHQILKNKKKWLLKVRSLAFQKGDKFLRSHLIRLLGEWKDQDSIKSLKNLIAKEKDPYLLYWANWALGRILGHSLSLSLPIQSKEVEELKKYWAQKKER